MRAIIEVPRDDRLTQLFSPEDSQLSRVSYELVHDEALSRFIITAQDAGGLRQALSGITKLLSLWEQSAQL